MAGEHRKPERGFSEVRKEHGREVGRTGTERGPAVCCHEEPGR